MRTLLSSALVGVLALTPACSLVGGTDQGLSSMEERDFRTLLDQIHNAGVLGGKKLQKATKMSAQSNRLARETLRALAAAISKDNLSNVDDVVRAVLKRFGEEIGSEEVLLLLQDATNLIDAAVGQVRLGINGLLTAREKLLVIALLSGVHNGLVEAAPYGN